MNNRLGSISSSSSGPVGATSVSSSANAFLHSNAGYGSSPATSTTDIVAGSPASGSTPTSAAGGNWLTNLFGGAKTTAGGTAISSGTLTTTTGSSAMPWLIAAGVLILIFSKGRK